MCTNCTQTSAAPGNPGPARLAVTAPGSIVGPAAPLSTPVDLTPNPVDPTPLPNPPVAPLPTPGLPQPIPPIPPLKLCHLDFRDGCYALFLRPNFALFSYEGTLRVDRAAPDGGADKIIVSGDLYTRPAVIGPIVPVPVPPIPPIPVPDPGPDQPRAPRGGAVGDLDTATATAPAAAPAAAPTAATPSLAAAVSIVEPLAPPILLPRPTIPIFPRARYHSYLKITSVSVPSIVPVTVPCQVTLVADEFDYTPPPPNQFKGTFPASRSRTLTIKLTPAPAPFPYSLTGGPYYQGEYFENGISKGSVSAAWVSPFFRRATVEIDTLAGAVAPVPVPNGSGGTDFFDTIFARTGWQLRVISDETSVPVPAGVNPTDCWSAANLHALMTAHRNPSTNLDAEWRVHLMVVPAKLGCGRGVMYDQIDVPREGCASFSDDGYPSNESASFGTAANKKQRDVPRAFLRSASHEITHTLNQIHQEQETSADNSIMTTTPSVANVLGGPTTGDPGVFPDQINLNHNATVRHHLNHMPDPVI